MPVAGPRFVLERDGDHHAAARETQRLVEHLIGAAAGVRCSSRCSDGDGVGTTVG